MLTDKLRDSFGRKDRVVLLRTDEEDRVLLEMLEYQQKLLAFKKDNNNCSKAFSFSVFVTGVGVVPLEQVVANWSKPVKGGIKVTTPQEPGGVLDWFYQETFEMDQDLHVLVFLDVDVQTEGANLSQTRIQRQIKEFIYQCTIKPNTRKYLIFMSRYPVVPPNLDRYVSVLDDPGRTEGQIQRHVASVLDRIKVPLAERIQSDLKKYPHLKYPGEFAVDYQPSLLKGLTGYEVDRALQESLNRFMEFAPVDPTVRGFTDAEARAAKRSALKKTHLIQMVDTAPYTFDQVGGLDRLKDWAVQTSAAMTPEGQRYGLKMPKGVLLSGVWGCGKSLIAKAIGNAWGMPLLQIEMGKLQNSSVGASEGNLYRVLKMVETAAPAILFVDEAEKSLAGLGSSTRSDGGVTARMIGILSNFLQETAAPITLVMTANTVEGLPPEIVRRTNEAWFVGLPQIEDRLSILKIHLKKRGQPLEHLDLYAAAEVSDQMVGSEIEFAVEEAMKKSFNRYGGGRPIDNEVLIAELANKPRLVQTCRDEMDKLVQWVGWDEVRQDGIRARYASTQARPA